jgi:crotonobetainyl-CoA:carnitine CoA-transferase CaiB-like acyl-CoA transferase
MYRTSDGWIVIACYSGDEWEAVRCALGLPSAEWPGYAQARQERLGDSNVARAIETVISQVTTSETERRLRAECAPCVVPRPVPIGELVREPGLRSRAMVVAEHHVEAGDILEPGHMIRFGTATSIRTQAAPIIGQHSVAIMRETGVPESKVDELINARIVNAAGREPGGPTEPALKHH